jgi:hypothetical protein
LEQSYYSGKNCLRSLLLDDDKNAGKQLNMMLKRRHSDSRKLQGFYPGTKKIFSFYSKSGKGKSNIP